MRQGQGARANQSGQCSRDSWEELASHVPGCFTFEESPGKSDGGGSKGAAFHMKDVEAPNQLPFFRYTHNYVLKLTLDKPLI